MTWDLLLQHWAIPVGIIALAIWAALDWKGFKGSVAGMMLYVEKNAETLLLTNGEAKHEWVVAKTYPLLPVWIKGFITEDRYHVIVEAIFQKLIALGEQRRTA